jgi:Mg-chelatase subunit ChlD
MATPGVVAITNGIVGGQTWAAHTHGGVTVDPDQHDLILNADPTVVENYLQAVSKLGVESNYGRVAFGDDSYNTNTSYRMLSQLGTESENGKLNLNYKNVTNAVVSNDGWNWTVDTHNKVGEFKLADGTVAQVNVEGLKKAMAEAQTGQVAFPIVEFYDGAVSNGLAGAQVADNGDFKTGVTTEDVSGLRYLITNSDVTSQPIAGGALQWGSSGGANNPAPAGVGGTVQAGNQNSIFTTRANQALNTNSSTEFGGSSGFGGGGGSRFSMIGPASGGKQVELAVANAPKLQPAEPSATIQAGNGGIPITGQLPIPRSVVLAGSGTDSWTRPVMVRGFYDDNLNSKSVTTNRIAEYAAANEELERAKVFRETIDLKTRQEQIDVNLPKARMVTIMDKATPGATEQLSFGGRIKETLTGKVERMASIQVDQERPDINVNGVQGNIGSSYDPYFLLTEFQTIQSHAVLGKVVKQLNLDGGDSSKTQAAEEKLKKNLDLRSVKNTKLIEIGAKSEKPEEAARIANAVADAYRDFRSEEYEALKHGGINSLQQQLEDQDQKIVVAQAKVDELRKSLGDMDPSTGAGIAEAQENDSALPKPIVLPPTPQPEILTRENAFSTFSLNVSDVSFKLAAATLEKGQMPEPGAIRSEEFINAFDYRDPDAAPGVPVAFASERARYPFAHNRELLRFSLKTAAAGRQAGRPLNIVLLLDNSGSMERADRVSIIREALRVLAGQLQAGDTFSIVTFARTAQLRVDGIPGNQAAAAAEEIAKLTPEGGTNLGEALELAYETARHHYLANGDNRVVLLTDGAANLGDVNADTLKQKVEAQRQQGIALDCFGIGWEGYNDDLLEVLTRHGDGRYGFINSPEEANTEFVAQIAGALHVAAADVKVQVEFNTNRVTSYRQIGYAKHQLTKEQFRDNTVDAAEIAAQEAGNALYTIEINPEGSGSIGTVRVRYKVPGTAEYREQAWDVPYTGGATALDQASPAMRLAATACAFSEWLATSPFAAEVSTDQLLQYMNGVPQFYGADGRPAKLEWMIRQAKSISGK